MHIDIQPFAEYAVAPYVGAWIETGRFILSYIKPWSRTLRGCVDGDVGRREGAQAYGVAPYVGAWIETMESWLSCYTHRVAPYVGAWIET